MENEYFCSRLEHSNKIMKTTEDKLKTKPTKDIYLAGGCFWGTEHYFKQMEGVVMTEVGFANGHTENPTYKEVYTDQTGFAETVFVRFYPDVVSLEFLLQMFFKILFSQSHFSLEKPFRPLGKVIFRLKRVIYQGIFA